jgi:Tfp pilus assembly protein PilN
LGICSHDKDASETAMRVALQNQELQRQLEALALELDLDEWTFDADAIHVQGSTTSFDTAEAIKTTVASLDLFRDVQLKDVKTTAGGKKVSFSLHLLLGSQKTERER